jgi:outer membrane lipoprotein-sorting protein
MSLTFLLRSIGEVLLALILLSSAGASSRADEIDEGDWILGEVDARMIALHAEDSLRADHSFMRARVTVRSSKRSKGRATEFECWNDRIERRSFVRILSPRSDAGVAFLDLPPNLWRYEPELERVQHVLTSAFLEPWMGSDFAIGDLLDPSSEIEDYEVALLGVEKSPEGAGGARSYVLQYTPKPTARAAWGKIVAWIETDGGAPLRKEFYAASGERLRTIRFSDIRVVAGRRVPHRWKATPSAAKGRESTLDILQLRFEAAFDDAIFSTPNLKSSQHFKPNG